MRQQPIPMAIPDIRRRTRRSAMPLQQNLPVMPPRHSNLQRHIDNFFSVAYATVMKCSTIQARARLWLADQMLYDSWHNLTDLSQITWQPLSGTMASTPLELARAAAAFTTFFHTHLRRDESTALRYAQASITSPSAEPLQEHELSALYLGVLQRGLGWIDLAKTSATDWRASHILQTVCRHRQCAMGAPADLTRQLENRRGVIIDEAALIAVHTGRTRLLANTQYTMETVRAAFAIALIDEWQDAALGLSLLPSAPVAPGTAPFWYDGLILQNANGLALAQISEALFLSLSTAGSDIAQPPEDPYMALLCGQAGRTRHLLGQPEGIIDTARHNRLAVSMHGEPETVARYQQRPGTREHAGLWLTRAELAAIVKNVMRELVIDPVHPGGTVRHAIATTLMRLGPALGLDAITDQEPAMLVRAFNRLEEAWHAHPHYIVRPTLSAAVYLVRNNNVVLFNTASPLSREQQIGLRTATLILPAIMLASGGSAANTEIWKDIIMVLSAQPAGQVTIPPEIGPYTQALYISIRATVTAKRNAAETIAYANPENLQQAMREYMHERLLTYAPLPVYDENFLIGQLLRREFQMSDRDLAATSRKSRTCTIMMKSAQCSLQMNSIEEFNQFSKSALPTMRINGHSVDAKAALLGIRTTALKALQNDKTIRAHLREVERMKGVNGGVAEVDISHRQHVLSHQMVGLDMQLDTRGPDMLMLMFGSATLKSVTETLARGDPREILGLLPFIVPLFDIEEGLRLGDRQRLANGALGFGRDALLWAIGAGVESILTRQIARDAVAMRRARMHMLPIERAEVDTFLEVHTLTSDMPVEDIPSHATPRSEDPYDVHNSGAGADLPGPSRDWPAPAVWDTRVPEGAHEMIEMTELASTPEMPGAPKLAGATKIQGIPKLPGTPAGVSAEVSRIAAAALRRRLLRIRGLPGGIAGITQETLASRPTVLEFLGYWTRAVKIRDVRRPRGDGTAIINTLFEKTRGKAYAEFEKLWVKLYTCSETAMIVINTAYERLSSPCHNCEIVFDAEKPQVVGNRMELPRKRSLSMERYFSPDGPMPFQQERVWIHEAVHWLTDLGDVTPALAAHHRGATVYLTDRILSELGAYPPVSPRIAYARPELVEGMNTGPIDPGNGVTKRRVINDWHIAENHYLDNIIDNGRQAMPGQRVLGRDISQRVTVRQAIQLKEFLLSLGSRNLGRNMRIAERVIDAFSFAADANSLKVLLSMLAHRSSIFRELAAAWLDLPRLCRIKVELRDYTPADAFHTEPNRLSGGVSTSGNTVWINRKAYYYFSTLDVTSLSMLRRLTGTILTMFLNDVIPDTMLLALPDASAERGLAVLLENEILERLSLGGPPRICAALTTKANAYLGHQSTIARAAASEDIHLRVIAQG